MSETVTISNERYDELLDDERELYALYQAGVDNWDGFDEAQEIIKGLKIGVDLRESIL